MGSKIWKLVFRETKEVDSTGKFKNIIIFEKFENCTSQIFKIYLLQERFVSKIPQFIKFSIVMQFAFVSIRDHYFCIFEMILVLEIYRDILCKKKNKTDKNIPTRKSLTSKTMIHPPSFIYYSVNTKNLWPVEVYLEFGTIHFRNPRGNLIFWPPLLSIVSFHLKELHFFHKKHLKILGRFSSNS